MRAWVWPLFGLVGVLTVVGLARGTAPRAAAPHAGAGQSPATAVTAEQEPTEPAEPLPEEQELVRCEVEGVFRAPVTGAPAVLLTSEDGTESLVIHIGPFEAMAIAGALEGAETRRPMTHDLLADVISSMGGTLSRVAVTRLSEGTFYATMEITMGEDVFLIDARPSDSIAVALRAGAPVYVARGVLDQAGEEPPEEPDVDIPFPDQPGDFI